MSLLLLWEQFLVGNQRLAYTYHVAKVSPKFIFSYWVLGYRHMPSYPAWTKLYFPENPFCKGTFEEVEMEENIGNVEALGVGWLHLSIWHSLEYSEKTVSMRNCLDQDHPVGRSMEGCLDGSLMHEGTACEQQHLHADSPVMYKKPCLTWAWRGTQTVTL